VLPVGYLKFARFDIRGCELNRTLDQSGLKESRGEEIEPWSARRSDGRRRLGLRGRGAPGVGLGGAHAVAVLEGISARRFDGLTVVDGSRGR
jgi:hypothetical protein